ncbi:MAG: hypothetical protein OI715_00980 (plasmid) [Candidatus Methanoperedens sp.]|nr:MAG: hypothetical protein OI715_00980 [Candidatus Methanoperedens sp.]
MKEELISITKELSNIAKELSINSRILAILIALETNTPINLSCMLNKIPLNYLRDRDFSYKENKAEIENSIKISFKDNDRNIYIFSNNIYPIEKFAAEVDEEIRAFKQFADIEIGSYSIKKIEIESFTTDNLLNLIIDKDLIGEGLDIESFESTLIGKSGRTQIKYSSPFEYLKNGTKEEVPQLVPSRISSGLAKIKTTIFYYRIIINGEYSYVKNTIDKFSNTVKLMNMQPKIPRDELRKFLKREPLDERGAFIIEKFLREYDKGGI